MTAMLVHDTLTLEQELIRETDLSLDSSIQEILLVLMNGCQEDTEGYKLQGDHQHGNARTLIFSTDIYARTQLVVTLIK